MPPSAEPKPDAVVLAEAQDYRANLIKHGLYKPELWWARFLAMVERERFQSRSYRWFVRCKIQVRP